MGPLSRSSAANRTPAPLNDPGRTRRLAPFGIIIFAGLAVALGARADAVSEVTVITIALCAVAIAGGLVLAPWERFPPGIQVLAPLLAVALIATTREAAGGTATGLSLLLIAPILWAGLYGTDTEVAVVIVAAGLAIAAPIAAGSETRDDLPRLAMLALVALLIVWLLRSTRRAAAEDALTGLANRRAWDLALVREVDRAARTGVPGGVVLMDLDNFKAFNDARGHAAGDELLRAVARAWSGAMRPYDLLARIGGEEFGVLLPATTADEAMQVADRLRRAVPDGQTCSAGVAVVTGEIGGVGAMRAADAALYAAKAGGRNRVVGAQAPAPQLHLFPVPQRARK